MKLSSESQVLVDNQAAAEALLADAYNGDEATLAFAAVRATLAQVDAIDRLTAVLVDLFDAATFPTLEVKKCGMTGPYQIRPVTP